jgi:putative nucleotidyltransferase with HDIG domain
MNPHTRAPARVDLEAGVEPIPTIGDDTTEMIAAALLHTVERRDRHTATHMRQVSDLSVAISIELGYTGSDLEAVKVGALLHDIGKIGTPLEFLTRPGPLSVTEYETVKEHASAGARIVDGVRFPARVRAIVVQHHERLNGSGYPHGLRTSQIEPEARIVAVADVVGAMACLRSYRPALGVPAALDEIERGSGELYDSDVVDACIGVFEQGRFRF